jgi:hypothetical protein
MRTAQDEQRLCERPYGPVLMGKCAYTCGKEGWYAQELGMRWQVCSELVILHTQCERKERTNAMACCLRDHSYTR